LTNRNQSILKIINYFKNLSNWTLYYLGGILLIFTFYFDNTLLRHGGYLRFNALDGVMLFLTDFGLLYLIIIIVTYLIYQKKFRLLGLFTLSAILSFEITYLLKLIFETPRPYLAFEVVTTPLTQVAGFSFPSEHATFCLTLIAFIPYIFKQHWQRWLTIILLLTIAYSRSYLGVHYFSDLLSGGMVGYFSASAILFTEKKYHLTDWFLHHVKDKLELRRQIAHLVVGLGIAFLLKLGLLSSTLFVLILILGGVFSLLQRKYQFPSIHKLLSLFERENDLKNFPGKGPFFLLLGSYFAYLLFPQNIAIASICILAVGDSVSHLFGQYLGKITIYPVKNKKLEGTLVAIGASTLVALLFVSFPQAFIGSFLVMMVEYFLPRQITHYLDDNLIIPILAGALMLLL